MCHTGKGTQIDNKTWDTMEKHDLGATDSTIEGDNLERSRN